MGRKKFLIHYTTQAVRYYVLPAFMYLRTNVVYRWYGREKIMFPTMPMVIKY